MTTLTKENAREGLQIRRKDGSGQYYPLSRGDRGWRYEHSHSYYTIFPGDMGKYEFYEPSFTRTGLYQDTFVQPPLVSTDQNHPLELPVGHIDRLHKDMSETLGRLAMINHRLIEEHNAQQGMCEKIDKELRRVTCAIDEIAETVEDEPIISALAGEIRESFDRIQDAILPLVNPQAADLHDAWECPHCSTQVPKGKLTCPKCQSILGQTQPNEGV